MIGQGQTDHVVHLLPGMVAGQLDDADARLVTAHLTNCEVCRAEMTDWQVIQEAVFDLYGRTIVDEEAGLSHLCRRIDSAPFAGVLHRVGGVSERPVRRSRGSNGSERWVARPISQRAFVPLATAALLALVLIGGIILLGPGRITRQQGVPEILPAISGSPIATTPMATKVILDVPLDTLPAGDQRVAVDRWRLQPSAAMVTLPAQSGVVIITVESGSLEIRDAEADTTMEPGDVLNVTDKEFSFRAAGATEAVAYVVYITPELNSEAGQSHSRIWISGDPLVHAMDFVISAEAEGLTGGAARLLVERLSVPLGVALPPRESTPFVWSEVGAGTLGLTLEGERLPYGWKPGVERKLHFGGEYFPHSIAPGTTLEMRNAGEKPLVLYQLSIVPTHQDDG